MAWQGYVDSSLCGSGVVTSGAIMDNKGEGVWAQSPSFEIKPEELKTIALLASRDASKETIDKLFETGVKVNGTKYALVAPCTEDEGVEKAGYIRRSLAEGEDAELKKHGIVIARSKTAIILGYHNQSSERGSATPIVEGLADYLKGVNY
jgi:profilin